MKKLLTCFFALQIIAPVAFAADGAISRALPSSVAVKTEAVAAVSARDNNSAATASRTTVASRVVVTQNQNSSNVANTTSARGTATNVRKTVSRSGGAANKSTSSRTGLDAATYIVGRNARVSEASINNNPAVRRAGVTLRPSTAEVGGRARIAGTDIHTGSNVGVPVRALQSRAALSKTPTRESISEAKERLEQTAELNKSCQDQYNECMDQFCAVIDSNQKRCSCSANLSRYTKVETAVKDANSQLNDVAQRIRYVGLSADEIRAIMSATEAEEALSGQRDTTETRSMLDDIEALIKDPTSSTSGTDTYSSLDLNLDFSSDSSNLFNLDFLNNSSGSMANLRGTDLYNAAKKRCNTVLTQCKNAGATQQQITANYDLAIDRDCIAYEQGLTKMNETLVSNVRSATLMLQKARMAVLQNKNQYDAKGCIAALDTCMRDEMVCGDDYLKCLDPTKRYIDENGKVVLGQNINNITAFMENYNNAAVDSSFLDASLKTSINETSCAVQTKGSDGNVNFSTGGNNGACVVKYLMQKIGTGQTATDGGLCRAVLDKCQRYTYTSDGKYKSDNDIVKNYIQRAMVNIQAGQQKAISDYASNCMLDLATCYNQQVTQVNTWTTSASVSSVRNVMSGACRNVALTCAYAVFAGEQESCDGNSSKNCIEYISNVFYQSLLCPTNSTYTATAKPEGATNYVNDHCECNTGYRVWGASCVRDCGDGETFNSQTGTCVTSSGAGNGFDEKSVSVVDAATLDPAGSRYPNAEELYMVGNTYSLKSCVEGYVAQGNSCVAADTDGGKCAIEHATKAHYDSVKKVCVVDSCVSGYESDKGSENTPPLYDRCLPGRSISCNVANGKGVMINGVCVAQTCNYGYWNNNGRCESHSCTSPATWDGNSCRCPGTVYEYYGNQCMSTCPYGRNTSTGCCKSKEEIPCGSSPTEGCWMAANSSNPNCPDGGWWSVKQNGCLRKYTSSGYREQADSCPAYSGAMPSVYDVANNDGSVIDNRLHPEIGATSGTLGMCDNKLSHPTNNKLEYIRTVTVSGNDNNVYVPTQCRIIVRDKDTNICYLLEPNYRDFPMDNNGVSTVNAYQTSNASHIVNCDRETKPLLSPVSTIEVPTLSEAITTFGQNRTSGYMELNIYADGTSDNLTALIAAIKNKNQALCPSGETFAGVFLLLRKGGNDIAVKVWDADGYFIRNLGNYNTLKRYMSGLNNVMWGCTKDNNTIYSTIGYTPYAGGPVSPGHNGPVGVVGDIE